MRKEKYGKSINGRIEDYVSVIYVLELSHIFKVLERAYIHISHIIDNKNTQLSPKIHFFCSVTDQRLNL